MFIFKDLKICFVVLCKFFYNIDVLFVYSINIFLFYMLFLFSYILLKEYSKFMKYIIYMGIFRIYFNIELKVILKK